MRIDNPKPAEIKALRERFKHTQVQMAEVLEVTPRTVQHWEGGTAPMSQVKFMFYKSRIWDLADKYSDVFNVEYEGLVIGVKAQIEWGYPATREEPGQPDYCVLELINGLPGDMFDIDVQEKIEEAIWKIIDETNSLDPEIDDFDYDIEA